MQQETFYIIIKNCRYRQEDEEEKDDLHLERIFSQEEILSIIEHINFYLIVEHDTWFYKSDLTVITNDIEILSKYFVAINIDDLKMLCGIEDFNNSLVRVSKNYKLYNTQVFEYFLKIQNSEIVSASMSYIYETRYDEVFGDPYTVKYFKEWITNKKFLYFKTPARYRGLTDANTVFCLNDIKYATLEELQQILNISILEIGNEETPKINWEWRNGYLRYYDQKSSKRFYITKELLQELKNRANHNEKVKLVIEAKLDKNYYIEYYATKIHVILDQVIVDEDDFSDDYSGNNFGSDLSYEKYNGAYGFDDLTIDNAFDGDPENYWNID